MKRADRFQSELYTLPYYRLVAEQNHDPRSADALLALCARYGRTPVRRGLELACGAALVSRDLAARGIAMTAVDHSPAMVTYARRQARARGLAITAVRANMIGYRPPAPVDLAVCFGPSTSHVLTNGEMVTLLTAVRDSLRPRGLFVVDFDFVPGTLFRTPVAVDPPWLVFDGDPAHVARGRDGDTEIEIRYGTGPTRYDPVRQLFQSHNQVVLRRGRRTQVHETPSVGKLYFPLEISALVGQVAGLEEVGREVDAHRVIVILRRAPATRRGARSS